MNQKTKWAALEAAEIAQWQADANRDDGVGAYSRLMLLVGRPQLLDYFEAEIKRGTSVRHIYEAVIQFLGNTTAEFCANCSTNSSTDLIECLPGITVDVFEHARRVLNKHDRFVAAGDVQ